MKLMMQKAKVNLMKKKNKIVRFFAAIFKGLYKILDKIIITPLSRFAYFISDKFSGKNNVFEKFFNNSNTLIYLSLIFAFILYVAVDRKLINIVGTESIVLSKVPIVAEYNEEGYVVEGLPEYADVVLMGRKADLYLAEQLSDEHKLTIDLSDYTSGTHKVKLKYNNPIKTLEPKIDPSVVTVVVYPKVSESRTLTTDILNTDKLDQTLIISSVKLNRDEVIIKSYKEKLSEVASVKALVDVNALNTKTPGTYTLENVKLVAYNENGNEIDDIEIVPGGVTATVTVTSPSKVVPVNIVPVGKVASGSAISSITSNVSKITLYGEESTLDSIDEIKVEIDVNGLSKDKTFQETIVKPNGIRSMSDTTISIKVKMEKETSKEFKGVPIEFENLDTSKYKALAGSAEDTSVDVIVKGVSNVLNKLKVDNIKAYVDLADLTEGEYEIPVSVTGSDLKLSYSSRTAKVRIIITKK